MKKVAVEITHMIKSYPPSTVAIDDISLKIYSGEWTVITGPSGSGKTTLLNIISCLERPTHGKMKILGKRPTEMDDSELTVFRREHLGMIFQQYHLIPYLNALENVEIAQYFFGLVDTDAAKKALERVGLSKRLTHIPSKLSGGEQQRVAIARALINEPSIILADEPTGNLDRQNGLKIMEILEGLHKKGMTTIFVTHDPHLAKWGDRIIHLVDGKIDSDSINKR
jgi:putative ABC transport system ATP-binding protein